MTPDELPADMEAVGRAILHLEGIAVRNEASENIIHQTIAKSIRALLKAYQEQRRALKGLLDHVDLITCQHDDTHRGGVIWTICDSCGRKWADDEGGFVPYEDAPAVAKARAALNQKGDER